MATVSAVSKRAAQRRSSRQMAPMVPPVTAEFRARAHELMDRVLNDHPGTTALLVCVAKGTDVDAASEPDAMALKTGMIDTLYFKLHPEKDV